MAATVATGTISTSQTRPVWFKGYFSHAISIISLLFTMQILKFFLKKHYCCILLHLVYLMVNLKACLTRKYSNLTHSNTRSHTWGTQRVESSDIYTHNMQNSHVNKKNPPVVHAVAIRRRHPSAILFFQPRRSGICVVMRGDCDR